MPQKNYPNRQKQKIDFFQLDENLIEQMANIIQTHKKINSYSLRKSLHLSITKFYYISKDCLDKYPKTITYDKKEKAYCFCAFMPKLERLEKELTV